MRYTPAQLKEALGISEETLRHWRRCFEPLQGKRGYAPCFTPADLLALRVVSELHTLGIGVAQLKPFAATLFELCSRGLWSSADNKALVFDGKALELVAFGYDAEWPTRTRIVVPLKPLVAQLQQRLAGEEDTSTQPEILFPPLGMRGGTK